MSIEDNIFKRAVVNFEKLEKYGFTKSGDNWNYAELFMNGDFSAFVSITSRGTVSGTVYEVATEDEFLPLRVENIEGFAGEVRTEYKKILEKIKADCCRTDCFVNPQANRLAEKIFDTYGDAPVFPWDKYNNHGVFKNPDSKKWYALIMPIDKSKLDKNLSGEVEIINLKADEAEIPLLHWQKGFYPAYHMNKKNWITAVLDDTVADDVLLDLIEASHNFTVGKHHR